MKDLRQRLANLLNEFSAENGSDTPDFVLASYLVNCLNAFDLAVCERERWYDRPIPNRAPPFDPNAPSPPVPS